MARKRQAPDPKPPTKNKKTKSIEDKEPNAMAGSSEQPRVTFMDLPVEIRAEIYEYVFAEDKPIALEMRHARPGVPREVWRYNAPRKRPGKVYNRSTREWVPAPLKHISILLASRQIFAEAEPALYGCNVFLFYTTTCLTEFIDRIGSRAEHLRHVRFSTGAYKKSTARAALSALSVAKNLRTLDFAHATVCPNRHSSSRTPEKIAEDCKTLMKSLQKYRKENDISGRVSEILKFTLELDCWFCDGPDDDDGRKQHEKLQAKARGIIDEYLELKDG